MEITFKRVIIEQKKPLPPLEYIDIYVGGEPFDKSEDIFIEHQECKFHGRTLFLGPICSECFKAIIEAFHKPERSMEEKRIPIYHYKCKWGHEFYDWKKHDRCMQCDVSDVKEIK